MSPPRVLLFDVFGTVVDWRGSIIAAGRATGLDRDWGRIADEWRRDGYLAPLVAQRRGEAPWRTHDVLMRDHLEVLAREHDVPETHHEALLQAWHELRPWPDAVPGLERLHQRFVLGPLSNGGVLQLASIARTAGLPWDVVLSTDLFRTYKPDPATYRGAVELLGIDAAEVMLVAAHAGDLRAAAACGLGTALVPRPDEWGPDAASTDEDPEEFDFLATDFVELAKLLGA